MNISNFPMVCSLVKCGLLVKGSKRIAETVEILLIKQSERGISVIFQWFTHSSSVACLLKEARGSLKPFIFY